MAERGRVGRYRSWRQRRLFDTVMLVPLTLVAIGLGGGVSMALRESGLADWLLGARPAVSASGAISRSFPVCAGSRRVTCVVDGDTFWLDGEKIRIADINTPEVSAPQCAAEAALGRRATIRLAQLLSEGPFTLDAADRDEDRYGRKLRVAVRDGQSIGRAMVAEGLAHEWRGRMEGWC